MLYLATPKEERTPLNETNYAKEVGVNPATLWKWKQLPGFFAEVNKIVDEHFADDYSEIADSFKRQAKLGSYNHQKTYFEMIGKYLPKSAIEVSGNVVIHMPDNGRDTE